MRDWDGGMRSGGRRSIWTVVLVVAGGALLGVLGAWPAESACASPLWSAAGPGTVGDGYRHRGHAAKPAAPGHAEWETEALAESCAQPAELRLEHLGYHDLGGNGLHADVWLHRGVAYVGTTAEYGGSPDGCPGAGVKVVDLADPARPSLVAWLAQYPGTTAEVMRVRAIDSPAFRGDLLAIGLQACADHGQRGLDLWDVSDPRAPRRLGFHGVQSAEMDPIGGVHELDLVQRSDGRVLALLAVPYSEGTHPKRLGDFRVVDVTDPRAPQHLAAWGAEAGLGQTRRQGLDPAVYGHSVHASPDGLRAHVSYWDAGVLSFDLADPAAPRLLGRIGVAGDEEGNVHSVNLAHGERVLVRADEVLDVESEALRVDGPTALAGPIRASGTLPAAPWPDASTVRAELAQVGRGCPAGDWTATLGPEARLAVEDVYGQDPRGKIALLDRGLCPFAAKLDRANAAGAVGAVVVNTDEGTFAPGSDQGPLGAFMVARSDGERLRAALDAGQSVQVTLSADLRQFGDFGGLSFWDVSDPARPRAIASFRTPRAQVDRTRGPARPGAYSAHNPVVRGDLLFASWFSDGVRVLDIHDPAAPRELAGWVPTTGAMPAIVRPGFEGVWGVAVEGDLVVASDMNRGLYILRVDGRQ